MGSKEIGLFSCQKDSYLKEVRMFFPVVALIITNLPIMDLKFFL